MPGVLLCSSVHQAHRSPYLGSSSVQSVRHLMGQSLLFSCQCWRVGGERLWVMAPPPMHDSAVLPCFHGCPAFLHRHFPPQSPPSHSLDLSLCSQQQPSPRDGSTTPKPAPRHCTIWGMYGCCKGYLILIPFRLP